MSLYSRFIKRSCSLIRKMASQTEHLIRTAAKTRQEIISEAEVKKIDNLSVTVKRLHLHVKDEQFSFKAGQWVDMFIPGLKIVGGFSMCSPPDLLVRTGVLHLAVKLSNHPPANWVHTKCQIGDIVKLRVGGDFFYDPKPGKMDRNLLLVAGGVGINPLYSILRHALLLHSSKVGPSGDGATAIGRKVSLLYSAKTREELIFQKEIMQIAESHGNLQLKMYTTQKFVPGSDHVVGRRIQQQDIEWALSFLGKQETEAYICGPLPFIDTVMSYCLTSGMGNDLVHYEKW